MLSFVYRTSFELTGILFCERRKAVSFHAVSFGPEGSSLYLRRMADIARDAQNNAPRDPLAPVTATVLSSYTQALDTVRAHISFFVGYIMMCINRTTLDPTCADVPGYRRVVAKAERGADALRWIILFVVFWCCVCDVDCLVRLSVVRYIGLFGLLMGN